MRVDIEFLEQKILGIVQNNFATKIAEINSEKGDSLLENIDSSYYYNDLYVSELNTDLFIFYGIKDPVIDSIGGDSAEEWTIFYNIFIHKQNELTLIRNSILRYTRALKEIVQENVEDIQQYSCNLAELSAVEPQDVEDIINETPYKMGGIEFKIKIA